MPREMPKFPKSSPETVERFRTVMDRHGAPDVIRKQMFGYPAAWVGGNILTGLFGDEWWVRVSDEDRADLLAMSGAHPLEIMPGKAMGASIVVPPEVVADDARLDPWLDKAIDFARTLPPKAK